MVNAKLLFVAIFHDRFYLVKQIMDHVVLLI